MNKLLPIAISCALLASFAEGRTQRDGRMVLVARDSISDPGLRAELAAIGGPEATRFVLALSGVESLPGVDRCIERESLADVNDRKLAQAIHAADVLVVRGGTFMGWFKSVYHERGQTLLAEALLGHVRERKTVIAYGGAAAFFCAGTTVPRSELERTIRNPRYAHSQVPRAAMRLGPSALFDSDDWPEGSTLRWIYSLWQTRMRLGFYFVGDVALDYSREEREVKVMGPGYVLACDLHKARKKKRSLDGARLSRLHAGDGWDFNFKRPLHAAQLSSVPVSEAAQGPGPYWMQLTTSSPATELGADPLNSRDQAPSLEALPDVAIFEFAPDCLTSAWAAPSSEQPTSRGTLLSLPMRVEWSDSLFAPTERARARR